LAHARNGRDKWQRVCSPFRTGGVVDIAAARKLSESTPLVNKRELVLAKHPNLSKIDGGISDKSVSILFEWMILADRPDLAAPRFCPFQRRLGNWILCTTHLHPKLREIILAGIMYGVPPGWVSPPADCTVRSKTPRSSEELEAMLVGVHKNLVGKDGFWDSILVGPSSSPIARVNFPIHAIPKGVDSWQTIFNASWSNPDATCASLNAHTPVVLGKVKYPETKYFTSMVKAFQRGRVAMIDVSGAYNHICVNEEFSDCLGFNFPGTDYWFKYTSMAFGARVGPVWYCVHGSMLPNLARYLRPDLFDGSRGAIGVWVDDLFYFASTAEIAAEGFEFLKDLMDTLGFRRSDRKTFDPKKFRLVLGLIMDLGRGRISLGDEKVSRYLTHIEGILSGEINFDRKTAEKLVGRMCWLSSFDDWAPAYLHTLYKCVYCQYDERQRILLGDHPLSARFHAEISYWKSLIQNRVLWSVDNEPKSIRVIYTDSSQDFFGSYDCRENFVYECIPDNMLGDPICIKELHAVETHIKRCGLPSNANVLVLVVTDNQNVQSVLNKHYAKAKSLRSKWDSGLRPFLEKHGIRCRSFWTRSKSNLAADLLSRRRLDIAKFVLEKQGIPISNQLH
jgi:hypothetical protein